MKNSFDIPWAAKLPFPSLAKEWVEYSKNPNYAHPDPMVRASRASDTSLMDFMEKDMQAKVGGNIDSAFALLCGSAIWRKPQIVRPYLDTLDTRPWWAVRLY